MVKSSRVLAIIPAAGSGTRMGADRAKQFLDLEGAPLLAVTLNPFQQCGDVDDIILVVPPVDVRFCREEILERFEFTKVKKVVPGGKRRQDSVRLGLEAAEEHYDLVMVHDGVRPLVEEGLIMRLVAAGRRHGAVIAALPAKETVKEVDEMGRVVKTHDRKRMWLVQTPQVFRYQDLLTAHRRGEKEGWEEATDDSLLIERLGIPVRVIQGSEKNIKVTTPQDLEMARFLSQGKEMHGVRDPLETSKSPIGTGARHDFENRNEGK